MNRIEVYSISLPGPKSQQDAVAVAVLPSAVVFCVVDGVSYFRRSDTDAPEVCRRLVDTVVAARPGSSAIEPGHLRHLLADAHRNLKDVGGLAVALAMVTETGACHWACSGDVALWVRLRDKNEWQLLNTSDPHGEGGTLKYFIGSTEGPGISADSLRDVREIAAMTDGFYEPSKNAQVVLSPSDSSGGGRPAFPLSRQRSWCPPEPPNFRAYQSLPVAQALAAATPRESDDNFSAVFARIESSPAADYDELDDGSERKLQWVMWLAIGLAAASVVLLFLK